MKNAHTHRITSNIMRGKTPSQLFCAILKGKRTFSTLDRRTNLSGGVTKLLTKLLPPFVFNILAPFPLYQIPKADEKYSYKKDYR